MNFEIRCIRCLRMLKGETDDLFVDCWMCNARNTLEHLVPIGVKIGAPKKKTRTKK